MAKSAKGAAQPRAAKVARAEVANAEPKKAPKKAAQPAGNPIFEVGSTKKVKNPIRCGIVGLGRIGWCHHAQAIFQHGGFELVAACDVEADRLAEAKAASGCATYENFEEFLKNPNVELVIVATPSVFHEPMSIAASKAGKHVLCEKPAAPGAKGIKRMMAAAKKAGTLLTMHHNYRLNPEFLYVREIAQSGILGKVVRMKRSHQGFARRNDWQVLRKYGGGMTGNWGIHLVDACLQILDSPVKDVWGDVKQVFNPGDAEDDIKAIIRGESGMTLDIDMNSTNAAPEPTWVLAGTCGTLWLQNGKAHLKYFNPKKLPKIAINDVHYAINRQYGVIPGPDAVPWEERIEEIAPKKKYQSYYDNLFDAIRKGKELLVTPESALRTYEVLDAIRKGSPWAPK